MQTMPHLLDYLLHIDTSLIGFVASYGAWTYLALFLVIFCETGLIVMPFLPGDSLLFAAGGLLAHPDSPLNSLVLFLLLVFASILGNQINYLIGRFVGPKVFNAKQSWFLNKKYLERAHLFYEKNGGKTIIIARFMPIIRTFVPFVAGVSYMSLPHFSFYNILSAFIWIGSLLGLGYFFGSLPIIKNNFSIVIYGIIAISLLPPLLVFLHGKVKRQSPSRDH
ncbi:MAG: DedA family protein [Legionella sp.]|nr:DedA family protein [Legionella sp.]